MIEKTTDKGLEFIEADCQNKDFEGRFRCSGKIRLIRFLYRKGVPLRVGSLWIDGKGIDLKPMFYSTLDYQHTLVGVMDYTIEINFCKDYKFFFKQFNQDGCGDHNNSVEKIQLFFDRKIEPMEWKSVEEHTPTISVMEKSQHDLLIFDGTDYHRGFAKFTLTTDPTNESVYDTKYFSHETGSQITNAVMFLEVEPVKRGHMNIWRTNWKK